MFVVTDGTNGAQLAASSVLPIRLTLHDGGVAEFKEVGQIEPWHTPRYTLTEVVDPEPVAVIPTSVSPRQARLALIEAGLFDQVTALISASSQEIQIGWEFAAEVRRDDVTLIALAGILGFSDRLDDLFVRASQI